MKKEKKNKKQNITVEEEKIEEQENITPQESSSPAPKKSFSKGSIITKIITGSLVLGTFAMLCYSVFLLIHDSTSSSVATSSSSQIYALTVRSVNIFSLLSSFPGISKISKQSKDDGSVTFSPILKGQGIST